MQAKENKVVDLLSTSNTQFTIPVYQRDYNWEEKQCETLFNDILNVSINDQISSYFIGSIVYIHEGVYGVGKKDFSIIDGQQRLTTIVLLLIAMYHKYEEFNEVETKNMIYDRYLIDKYMQDSCKIKLVPPSNNLNILKKILHNEIYTIENKDNNMVKNYLFFIDKLKDIDFMKKVMHGIEKLIYVDIALEKGKDNPQRIFESLNSTGLDLSQGDLIRNFILMDLDRETQNRIFNEYWIEIENNTKVLKKDKITIKISDFMRDYIILKSGKIPNKNRVFEEFKNLYQYKSKEQLENELKEIK